MPESVDIYIGLGSNQGNREQLIEKAIEHLSVALGAPIQQSTIIETEPWGFESDFPFLNMVACFNCNLQPLELLDLTEKTEKSAVPNQKGRKETTIRHRILQGFLILFSGNIPK